MMANTPQDDVVDRSRHYGGVRSGKPLQWVQWVPDKNMKWASYLGVRRLAEVPSLERRYGDY